MFGARGPCRMRVIHIFTATSSWRDIVRSIYALDPHVQESVVIAHDEQPLPENLRNTRHLVAPEGIRGIRFWWWAAHQARAIIRKSEQPDEWIVSEQVVGITLFILRYILRFRCRSTVFFVFPTFKFLRERGWNADRYARPLALSHRWFHIRDMAKRSVIEVLSILGSDVISANSQEILDSNRSLAGWRKSYLLPNSVTKTAHQSPIRQSDQDGVFNIIFVAAMQPHKGVALAMEMFARIMQEMPQARLILVGTCYHWDKAWFQQLLEKYQRRCGERISYRGKLPFEELAQVYGQADIFLFPSFYEGSPRVICEAMQYGCAVVTSDLPGNRLIDPQGEALQYFRPGNIEAALSIVRKLAANRDSLNAVRNASRRLIETRFTADHIGAMLLRIYQSMLPDRATLKPAPDLVENGA